MPRRKQKKYSRPKKIFDKTIIKEENALIKKYGLKSRREVWRADFAIERIRNIAKSLITEDENKKESFVQKQREKGFEVKNIAEVLGLDKEDYLKRRLQSIVVKRGLAKTHNQARQFITHKHVLVNGNLMDSPSHLTTLKEEENVRLNLELPSKKEMTNEEEIFLRRVKKGEEIKSKEKIENKE